MNKLKTIGYTLISLSIIVFIAMFVESKELWLVVDLLMILICLISGIMLIKNK